jgi:aspartyl-tRNA(Asn)/glutamyl-tRNA(Gln) amidotransferase subunit B
LKLVCRVLPVMNKRAVERANCARPGGRCGDRAQLGVRAKLLYPDLPKGYQISQFEILWCRAGVVRLERDGKIELRTVHPTRASRRRRRCRCI